ncbi:ferredoxin--NADP reductase [Actinocorallia populi]|uniref:ferredoxin--NADP reductase n=1 Tax=Actinocorallia populi TaxID=2079200 RepID=UPI000D093680|nr:ferredoxin--NADP reductase [Actinocorallia populi]
MARDHGFHPIRVKRVIQETADTRTYVLDTAFDYEAGQFMTFKVCGTLRSYSMSSSPTTDTEVMTTVKRVPGGLVSNWMHDHLSPGDLVEATLPAGVFCLRENGAPLVAFCGGSGVTPVLSLVKTALATTDRRVRLLTADRDADAVIFGPVLDGLAERYPGRFELRRHLDTDGGFLTEPQIREFAGNAPGTDFYVCGPDPFMDLVERVLLDGGTDPSQILIERFGLPAAEPAEQPAEAEGTITIVLGGKKHTVPQHSGETLLQSARRAGLSPPFSCEAGNCATCIAQVTEGAARMQINNALEDDEIADGWVLTCQGEPTTPDITVVYED